MTFLQSLQLRGLLSFTPDAEAIALSPLNVIVGPNASGKSNLIEAIELLHATPTAFAAAIRDGGGVREWLWKGNRAPKSASIEAIIAEQQKPLRFPELRYRIEFASSGQRTEVLDEVIENSRKQEASKEDVFFYYRFQKGNPVINVRESVEGENRAVRRLERQSLVPDESVLSQRKDPDAYPEVTWLAQQFSRIQTFREWSFGRYGELRKPQPTDLPNDQLLPDSRNLGLILNKLEHSDNGQEFNRLISQFLPRYHRFSTLLEGSTVQIQFHEDGLAAPVPATRLSDGTIRFIAMLALLLSPNPPPLLCMEEPELGLHPDAVGLLAEVLVDASRRMQLIVTTHSDALVSALTEEANSVLVCEHRNGTVIERLDPDKLAYWLDKYRLGEIWRIGELGGNP